ncbi:MAG: EAL domain-containing protein, partial [Ruminococcus sp.]|nr:EAL domain-containing protein [Ruminococcus sp.]
TEEDFAAVKNAYGELMEKVVIELTEQTELDDESLQYTLDRIKSANMQLAIDDYGTGYSNTSNLLRYHPQVVKIDRSLIAGIDRNPKMQKFVAGVIDFLHASGMLALGEGVETVDEVRTLINMSVDLLQGFYVSRPKPVFVNSISEDIRQEIVNINLEASGLVKKLYHAADGETVSMQELALERYTEIFIDGGSVTLNGTGDGLMKLPISVADGAECVLMLKNVSIEAEDDQPAISIGSGCNVQIVCEGKNRLEHSGIFLPGGSKLQLSGAGDFVISPEAHDSYAIGAPPGVSYGDILIDMNGHLELNVNGEYCVGIGGGKSGTINITAGSIEVNCTSGSCVAIGSTSGGANVKLRGCAVSVKAAAANAVCIGSMQGNAVLEISDSAIDCSGSGNRLCGIGTMEGSRAQLTFSDMKLFTEMRGKNIICIGSYGGVADCDIQHASVSLYAEGGRVSGVGDMAGGGRVFMRESELNITFLTGEGFDIGSPYGTAEFKDVIRRIRINE